MNKVLFISVHPDDETLGCGGTILKHFANGDKIYWLILTDIHERDGWSKKKIIIRKNEIDKVSKFYSFDKTYNLGFSTTKLDQVQVGELIGKISNVLTDLKPEIIYVNNRSDIHTDHQIAFNAIISCTKSFRYPFIKRVMMYECLSETEFAPPFPENNFLPNVFIDISDFMNDKLKIMGIYKSEVMKTGYPRSFNTIKALAAYRGSAIGVKYAESFQLIKEIL